MNPVRLRTKWFWLRVQLQLQEKILNEKFQRPRVFVQNDLSKRKIRSRRLASKQLLEFKEKLGLDPNEYSIDEKDINALQVAFEREIMHTEYCV